KVIVTAKGEKEVAVPDYYRTEIYLKSGLIPALGYKTLQVKAVTTEMDQLISISKQTIENEKIIVQFENGKINLLNKEQQSIINDLIRF
ncbi:hypothetical protein QSI17_22025, partial [Aeromonas hydrophila]